MGVLQYLDTEYYVYRGSSGSFAVQLFEFKDVGNYQYYKSKFDDVSIKLNSINLKYF